MGQIWARMIKHKVLSDQGSIVGKSKGENFGEKMYCFQKQRHEFFLEKSITVRYQVLNI